MQYAKLFENGAHVWVPVKNLTVKEEIGAIEYLDLDPDEDASDKLSEHDGHEPGVRTWGMCCRGNKSGGYAEVTVPFVLGRPDKDTLLAIAKKYGSIEVQGYYCGDVSEECRSITSYLGKLAVQSSKNSYILSDEVMATCNGTVTYSARKVKNLRARIAREARMPNPDLKAVPRAALDELEEFKKSILKPHKRYLEYSHNSNFASVIDDTAHDYTLMSFYLHNKTAARKYLKLVHGILKNPDTVEKAFYNNYERPRVKPFLQLLRLLRKQYPKFDRRPLVLGFRGALKRFRK